MPDKRVANGADFYVSVGFMHRSQVQVSIDVEKGNFTLKRLLGLVEVYLQNSEGMLNCEVKGFSCSDLEEFHHFVVGCFDHC
jgi:hypothetical protein